MLLGVGIGLIVASLLILFSVPAPKNSSSKQITKNQELNQRITKSLEKEEQKTSENILPSYPEPSTVDNKVALVIPSGSSSEKIAHILADSQVIDSVEDFSRMCRALKVERKFIAGKYTFNKGENLSSIIAKLIKGPEKE